MFRILRLLISLTLLGGLAYLFQRNNEEITIYFLVGEGKPLPAYLVYLGFIMFGIVVGYIISLKNVFSYRSEISKLVKTNKEISEELDSLRNVAVGEEFTTSFTEKE
tara:strand:- start:135 stop:455 length:321 start_codon:yes stop_codon:yes gene_type:complete